MPPRRLSTNADPASSPPRRRVRISFDGRTIDAVEGEPLAVALLAAGRPILSRSFRFHRPRGLMCDTGQCGWCECEVDGRPSVRSCQVPVRDGLVARSEHAWPSADRDLFGLLDAGSRLIPPTFYHHRFLRPRRLRQRYLDVIRAFGGRGRLPVGRPSGPRSRVARDLDIDVLVVGGGRSGSAAAEEAAGQGSSVVLVEAVPGRARPRHPGIRFLDGATAVGWYDGVVTAIDDSTLWSIRASSVVVATGTYERIPLVRGADRPGVIGARRVVDLIVRHDVLPGERALLVGDGADLGSVDDAIRNAGGTIVAKVATSSLRRILGRRQVSGVVVVGERDQPTRLAVDLVVIGDRTPNLDLILAAGASVERRDGVLVPVLDDDGRSTVPGLSVVGAATGRDVRPASGSVNARALVCFCEDVHVDEIRAQVTGGYADPELVKRRTGALTGPCQGKYCLQGFCAVLEDTPGSDRLAVPPTTARPPLRPIRLGDLVAIEEGAER
ncbi:MAG TPA: 2Fe-2S iron-sulfur cluster-binding protein [Candidatus Limnocylindrales bacterium]|nr:2Fe-2S iron-sulfur cluster-binding protein [Candidatus Limnocylindrales bacterium]